MVFFIYFLYFSQDESSELTSDTDFDDNEDTEVEADLDVDEDDINYLKDDADTQELLNLFHDAMDKGSVTHAIRIRKSVRGTLQDLKKHSDERYKVKPTQKFFCFFPSF